MINLHQFELLLFLVVGCIVSP